MGIFSETVAGRELFQRYVARLAFRSKLLGGVPKDPHLVEAWLRARAGINDEDELHHAWLRTLGQLGLDTGEQVSVDDAVAASRKLAETRLTTGFKVDSEHGLYVEARQVKAGLRENINILYGGQRVGPTRKGARAFVAERVFVTPDRLYLDRREPDGVELIIGHLSGPQGPRSVLSYHEYVEAPAAIEFTVLVAEDAVPQPWWPRVWTLFEQNGLGATRSQGFGTFDLVRWDRVDAPTRETSPTERQATASLFDPSQSHGCGKTSAARNIAQPPK
jgi:hypothetical protein